MQLNKREKTLAAVAGAAVLLLGGWLLLGVGGPSLGELRAQRDRLADEKQKKQARVAAAQRAAADLAAWNRRALPADPAHARSLYQNWLRELADRAGLRQLSVVSSEGQSLRNAYTFFSFTVRGRAGLGPLTQFMYDFYSAGHLHQLRRVDIKSVEASSDLDLTMTIEALSLAGADRKDRLSQEPGRRLKSAKLADYREVVAGRNLFAPPAPPSPSAPETPPGIDRAKHIVVVAIVNADGRDEVWLMDRIADKLWRLQVGHSFQIGPVRGRVQTIGPRDVVLVIDGRPCRLRAGEDLRTATGAGPLPAQAEKTQDRPARGTDPAGPRNPNLTSMP